MRRQLYQKQVEAASQALPVQEVVYTRQSTTGQVLKNTESLEMQLSQKGDAEEVIMLIEGLQPDGTVKGVSGTKTRNDRPMLQEAYDLIASAKQQGKRIKLKVYSVSRLFRTKSRVPVEEFIDLCKANDVLIQTQMPPITYDFSVFGMEDLFREQYKFSRMYNEQVIESMHEHNRQQSLRGEYDGRSLIVGFIVDRDKTSPTFGKFIVYEPHARVVRWLYKRYCELGGQLNLLWHEVRLMDVVFNDFEEWVSPLDARRLLLRKVPGGYHISRNALVHLLTSVEYIGYWKLDGQILTDRDGKPEVNHAAIVELADWRYAFERLSFTNLDGTENKQRAKRSWVPAKKEESAALLHGLLTSPLGTVQYSATDGLYRVMEKRNPNDTHRSATLTVKAPEIDAIAYRRMIIRCFELYDTDFLDSALEQARRKNAKALIDYDKQIARYEKSIRTKQAQLAALGEDFDIETAKQYNADIKADRAELNALREAKTKAEVEESGIAAIHQRLRAKSLPAIEDIKDNRRFLRLLAESITLDEYSGHFLTLTIVWRSPFSQVDVCYIYREDSGHQAWSTEDEQALRELYPDADRLELLQRFPTRTWSGIYTWANQMGLSRNTQLNTSGITNRYISLKDYELVQAIGSMPGRAYQEHWLYDIDAIGSSLQPPALL